MKGAILLVHSDIGSTWADLSMNIFAADDH